MHLRHLATTLVTLGLVVIATVVATPRASAVTRDASPRATATGLRAYLLPVPAGWQETRTAGEVRSVPLYGEPGRLAPCTVDACGFSMGPKAAPGQVPVGVIAVKENIRKLTTTAQAQANLNLQYRGVLTAPSARGLFHPAIFGHWGNATKSLLAHFNTEVGPAGITAVTFFREGQFDVEIGYVATSPAGDVAGVAKWATAALDRLPHAKHTAKPPVRRYMLLPPAGWTVLGPPGFSVSCHATTCKWTIGNTPQSGFRPRVAESITEFPTSSAAAAAWNAQVRKGDTHGPTGNGATVVLGSWGDGSHSWLESTVIATSPVVTGAYVSSGYISVVQYGLFVVVVNSVSANVHTTTAHAHAVATAQKVAAVAWVDKALDLVPFSGTCPLKNFKNGRCGSNAVAAVG